MCASLSSEEEAVDSRECAPPQQTVENDVDSDSVQLIPPACCIVSNVLFFFLIAHYHSYPAEHNKPPTLALVESERKNNCSYLVVNTLSPCVPDIVIRCIVKWKN